MGKRRRARSKAGNRKRYKNWTGKSVSTGSGPNQEQLAIYHSHANSMGRVIPSDGNPDHPLPYIKHRVEEPHRRGKIGATQPMRERTVRWHEEMLFTKTPFAEQLMQIWQSDRRQGVDKFNRVILFAHGTHKITLFFSGPDFVFIEETARVWRRSITYDVSARKKRIKDIVWVEWKEHSNDPELPMR